MNAADDDRTVDADGDDDALNDDVIDDDVIDDDVIDDDDDFVALLRQMARTPRVLVGTMLGRYRVDHILGAGGMGTVYAAHDTTLARDVALKVLHDDNAARILAEARAAASLSHDNVCAVYDSGVIDDTSVLVLERLTGETLRARIQRGDLVADDVTRIATDVARALAHAHDQGFAHRDLKPENVMVTSSGRAKLLDFGIVDKLNETARPSGTKGYMDPHGDPHAVDARADVYAFGVMLDEMCTVLGHALTEEILAHRRRAEMCRHADRTMRPRDGTALLTLLREAPTSARAAHRRRIQMTAFAVTFIALVLVVAGVRLWPAPMPIELAHIPRVSDDAGLDLRFRAAVLAFYAGDHRAARYALDEVRAARVRHPAISMLDAGLAAFLAPSSRRRDPNDAPLSFANDAVSVFVDDGIRGRRAPWFHLDDEKTRAEIARGHALFTNDEDAFFERIFIAMATPVGATGADRDAMFASLEAQAPRVAIVAIMRAHTLMHAHDDDGAVNVLRAALVRMPGNLFLNAELGAALVSIDPTAALTLLNDVVAARPDDALSEVARAEAFFLLDDKEGAARVVDQLLHGAYPKAESVRGVAMMARLFSSRGHLSTALGMVQAVTEKIDDDTLGTVVDVIAMVATDCLHLGHTALRAEAQTMLADLASVHINDDDARSRIDAVRATLAAEDLLARSDLDGFAIPRARLSVPKSTAFATDDDRARVTDALDAELRARKGERYGVDMLARLARALPRSHPDHVRLLARAAVVAHPLDDGLSFSLANEALTSVGDCQRRTLFVELGCRSALVAAASARVLSSTTHPLDDEARKQVEGVLTLVDGEPQPTVIDLAAHLRASPSSLSTPPSKTLP